MNSGMSYFEEEKQQKLNERMVDIDFVPSVRASITINGYARELSGFASGADYDRAISYSLKRQKYYDILLQEQYDKIVSVRKEISEIDSKYDLLNLIPEKQKELDVLMQEGLNLKAEKEDEERYCKAVREARKQYMLNLRNEKIKEAQIHEKFHKDDSVYDRLENAKNELKQLEVKIYKETADKFEQDRYNDLKDFVIPGFEEQLKGKGIVDWSKAKLKDVDFSDNVVADKKSDELENEQKDGDESSLNDEEKEEEKENEEEMKQENPLDNVDLKPEKPKKVKFLSKAGAMLKSAVDSTALKAVMGLAAGLAAIALIVTNPALLALVPAAKIAYDFNQGRKM